MTLLSIQQLANSYLGKQIQLSVPMDTALRITALPDDNLLDQANQLRCKLGPIPSFSMGRVSNREWQTSILMDSWTYHVCHHNYIDYPDNLPRYTIDTQVYSPSELLTLRYPDVF